MITIYNNLAQIRKQNKNKKIVMCAGVFDLFHIGHLKFLQNCKKIGEVLVVCIKSDEFVKESKGPNRPIINENERINIIDNIKCVDFTILLNKKSDINDIITKYNIPISDFTYWERYYDIITNLKPDYIVHADDYKADLGSKSILYNLTKTKHKIISSTNHISTSKIINKIQDNN